MVYLEKVPLTPNGKVDRKALPEPESRAPASDYIPPGNEIEKKLTVLWDQVLGIDAKTIGITDNFFELGGHSLKVTLLVSKIHKEFHAKIPLAEVFKNPTIQGLAQHIREQALRDQHTAIAAVENKDYYPLASAQKRLFILQQVYKESTGYNSTSAMIIEGDIDRKMLEETFGKLINRHESLRTSFLFNKGEPVQRVHGKTVIGHWSLVIGEADENEIEDIIKNFVQPFDLSRPPLLRVGLIKINEKKHLLIIDMHHIISDGVSHTILVKDFMMLYGGVPLPDIPIQYKDFSEWQHRRLETSIKAQEKYWLQEFEEKIPEPDLPLDYQRPTIKRFQGKTVKFTIEKELTGKLKELIRQTGTTLNMLLLAVYHILLFKYTMQEDIIIGVPVTGRRHTDLQDIVGMFVNMLAIRNKSQGWKTFAAFLLEVKQKVLTALENQDYQFEELVKNLGLERDMGRNPLINVVFDMVNIDMNTAAAGLTRDELNLDITPYELEHKGAVFDLILMAGEGNDTVDLELVYATALFKTDTVKKMTQRYITILEQILGNPGIKLEDIKISHELKTVKSNIFESKSEFGF
jgi:acyl carrier protein